MCDKVNDKRCVWRRYAIIALSVAVIPIVWLGAHQAPQRTEILAHLVSEGLSRWHYTGKKIDDQLSRNALGEYIDFLDFGKRFLYVQDVERIIPTHVGNTK